MQAKGSPTPRYSREPFSCLTITLPCLPRRIPSPPPQPPLPSCSPPQGRGSFEPFSPLLGRLYSQKPAGSSPPSPCFDRFSFQGSPSPCQQNPYYNCIGSPRSQRPCPPNLCFCYCSSVTSPPLIHQPPRTSPVTSPQLTHISLETGSVISTPGMPGSQGNYSIVSPLLTHRPLRTGLTISPPLVHRPLETSPLVTTAASHRVLETGPMISHWSSGEVTVTLLFPRPQLHPLAAYTMTTLSLQTLVSLNRILMDLLGKMVVALRFLFRQACLALPSYPKWALSIISIFAQNPSYLPLGVLTVSTYHLSESSGSPNSSEPPSPQKTCLKSFLSWDAGGNSYLLLTPGSIISGPPGPTEPPPPQCPYPSLYFQPSLGNQLLAPHQTPRSYNEPPLPTPVPQVKSPKFSDSCPAPYRCHSLVNTPHHTPLDHPKSLKTNTSPQPPSQSFVFSNPLMKPAITTTSNSLPKELPPETTVDTGTLKTVASTSCPQCLPYNPLLPSRYSKSSPHGPPPISPCNTHMYSVVPPTSHSSPLSSPLNRSTRFPQCHNQPVVPCGTSAPRGPPPPNSKPVVPPCSTHIYSFIPLRTPFDPRCLPVVPRARLCPNTIPCGLHTYAVSPPGPLRDPPQIPYSCSLPSSKSSTCSATASCSSTIIISECHSCESQSVQNKSRSQNKSALPHQSKSPPCRRSLWSRSRSWSSSPPQGNTQFHGESSHLSITESQSEKYHLTVAEVGGKSRALEVIKLRAGARVLTVGKVMVGARVHTIRRNDDHQNTSSDQNKNPD